MQFVLKDNLPFTSVVIGYKGSEVEVTNVLIDTGSATSIFSTDIVEHIQIVPLPQDILQVSREIGGTEVDFKRRVDFLKLGEFRLPDFEIEVGGMDYGFDIHGILGMDFLIGSGASINLKTMQIQFDL
jgi:hypothetical protein